MSKVIPAARAARRSTLDHPTTGQPPRQTPIRRVRRFVGAHQLGVFIALVFPLSWWGWLLSPGQHNPTGPVIAAFLVVALSDRGRLKRFARQVRDVRVSPPWLAAAILVPVVVVVGSVAINTLLGAPAPTGAQLGLWTGLPLVFLEILIFIGLGEEIGWTAFAVPRALAGRTVVVALVLLAALRALWHLPLWLSGELHAIEFLTVVAIRSSLA
jgi:membrane protease YdiL (CAAX protease family)